ncbi:MAG: RHS repeat-associated core domain-containing protein [Bacilli bacterium]|nr:RHS repeat-associated core domain-containing protein [Bacilli bacterium]
MNKLENIAIITSSATITSSYTYDSFTKTVDQTTTNYETLRIKELNIQKTVNNITTDLINFTYTYDSHNNITSITRYDNGSLTTNYVEFFYYDDLTNALMMHELMFGSDYVITSYTYDERGNITNISRDANGVTSTISLTYSSTGWLDQLQTITKGGVTYNVSNYQTIGNPLNYRGYTVTYDQRSITGLFDGINTYLYSYNANGIRTSKTVNGVITTYVLEESKIIQEVKYINPEDYYGNIILDYYYDSNDNIIGFNYNGVFYQYIKNLQNDIIAIADRNGTILVKYVYDAYGNIISITDTSGIDLGNINPFRFKSYYYDTETGFYYLNSRYYDALVGRFVNADDIAYLGATGSAWSYNLFAYCENNPVNNVDYLGTSILDSVFSKLVNIKNGFLSISRGLISGIIDGVISILGALIPAIGSASTLLIGVKGIGKIFGKKAMEKVAKKVFSKKIITALIKGIVFLCEKIIGLVVNIVIGTIANLVFGAVWMMTSIGNFIGGIMDLFDGTYDGYFKLWIGYKR